MPSTIRVFVAHSTMDAARVSQLLDELRGGIGWSLVFERYPLRPDVGDGWKQDCRRLMETCQSTLCLFGTAAASSAPIDWELRTAHELGHPLLAAPLVEASSPPPALSDCGAQLIKRSDALTLLRERSWVESVLFQGKARPVPETGAALLEQYKLLVGTSEALVARRQTVSTSMITINAFLLGALGTFVDATRHSPWAVAGIACVGAAGILLCESWARLVRSLHQLNRGKFAVIDLLEERLPAAPFRAEWEALGRGRDAQVYRPYGRTERWVPRVFQALYVAAAMAGAVLALQG